MTETHASKRFDIGFDFQAYLVTGIEEAEIDIGSLQHEPEQPVSMPTETKLEHDTLVGERVDANQPSQRPHEEVGIQVFIREILSRPSVAPRTQCIDHWTELATTRCQMVFLMSIRSRSLLDDPASLQGVQALRQEIPGNPWDATVDVGESPAAHEQLAQNERGPALGEDLGAECHGTKLSVGGHALT